ncbi:hypothetical protein VN97_g13264 [Penicillium thymicola]|uniref:Uncharacterized protein n=1 Tax=Penicillium thymicola TaxID=293382 RepID=A0AAI9T507_PENTH|nr:hypothetical protein VN97_g13264 [Penicillium thymicola]
MARYADVEMSSAKKFRNSRAKRPTTVPVVGAPHQIAIFHQITKFQFLNQQKYYLHATTTAIHVVITTIAKFSCH